MPAWGRPLAACWAGVEVPTWRSRSQSVSIDLCQWGDRQYFHL